MNCQDVQGQLSDYLDFSLSAAQLALVKKHLAACPPCREEAEVLSECIRQVGTLPVLDVPLGFTQRVMSHVREEATQPSFWQRFLLPLSGKLPAQATAVVIVGFLGIYLLQREQPQQQLTIAREAITPAATSEQDSTLLVAKEPNSPKTSAIPQTQSSPTQAAQIAPSVQQPGSNSQDESRSHVEPMAALAPAVESVPDPSLREPTAPGAPVRPKPVVSGTPVPTAPMPPSSGANSFSNRSDPDISAFRASPINIEPFADLELILRRHTAPPAIDGGDVRKTDVGQAAAPRPIERLMAAIPDRTRPQTIWINVPEDQYESFKSELYTIGIIESESRVPMLREQTGGYADRQIRVKLTAVPAPETASPNNALTDR
jgi:anti-sigma factor RsiW